MKKLFLSFSLPVFILFFSAQVSRTQNSTTDFLQFGTDNAGKLSSLYLGPLGQSLGNNMNNGWYNTAQAHRLGRFDFRIGFPVTLVSEPARMFRFVESDFEGMSLVNPSEDMAPSVFGNNESGPLVSFAGEEFALPPGTGINFFPVLPPSLQLNLGVSFDTELMFRYLPNINVSDFSTRMIGFGIKHGIKQHIPGISLLPFDLSVIVAYSRFQADYGLNYNPENNSQIDTDEQKMEINATAFNANLIISKKLSVITFFGGFRYMTSNTGILMAGTYPVAANGASTGEILTNPVNINMNGGHVGLNGGFRLKLGFLSMFADATLARYSSVNVGMSMGFHN